MEFKTNWTLNETVMPEDMNNIGKGLNDLDSKALDLDKKKLDKTGGTVTGTINATNLQVGGANVYTTSRKPSPSDIGASASNHIHDDRYYTEAEIDVNMNKKLDKTGGTMTGTLHVNSDINILGVVKYKGTTFLRRSDAGNVILSGATTGDMYLRPQGDTVTEGQVIINSSGVLNAPNLQVGGANVYTTSRKPTVADIGASPSNHNHDTAYLGKTAKAESSKVADAVAWGSVTGKPSTFAPIVGTGSNQAAAGNHNHDTAYLGKTAKAESSKVADAVAWGSVTGKPSTFAPIVGTASNQAAAGNHNHYYTLGEYTSSGTQTPANLGSGKLKLNMLNSTTSGLGGWADVLWMSSYAGADVKTSNALVMSKVGPRIGFKQANYDATAWGRTYEIYHEGNKQPVAWGDVSGKPSTFAPIIGTASNQAAAGNHTHSYLPLSGGTITGELKVNATNGINFSNDDKIIYDDTNNIFKFSADAATNKSIVQMGKLSIDSQDSLYPQMFAKGSANVGIELNRGENVSYRISNEAGTFKVLNNHANRASMKPLFIVAPQGNANEFRTTGDHCWAGFYRADGKRYGYVGNGSPGNNVMHVTSDIDSVELHPNNYYTRSNGNFNPYSDNSHWLGTNSPQQRWIGMCSMSGVIGGSDARFKQNIVRMNGEQLYFDQDKKCLIRSKTKIKLEKAMSSEYYEFIKSRFIPTYYNYKAPEFVEDMDGNKKDRNMDTAEESKLLKNIGFIAQDYDLENDKVAQEFIIDSGNGDLMYNHMSYVTVGMIALQEAIKKIDKLEEELQLLKENAK
ncbi:MAG: hypothetical protein RR620_13015 [Clostridium sp.]